MQQSFFPASSQYAPTKFPYKWSLKDGYPALDKGAVFSCFSCGGGSTMGYKLAGYNVIGCNEIDPKMMAVYRENHHPKYSFLEPIQQFKDRQDLPAELYNLAILDGSPPCSSFSMAGNREKDWGKEKKFREGQAKQVLDTLFFDFIDLGKRLQPRVIIAENVKGLMLGSAYQYLKRIYTAFREAGYSVRAHLLDASTMGVPQRRERVFFTALRLDLAEKMGWANKYVPEIDLNFNERPVVFGEISDKEDTFLETRKAGRVDLWSRCEIGHQFSDYHTKGFYFSDYKLSDTDIVPTITASIGDGAWHPDYCRLLNKKELCKSGTFPEDYYFNTEPKYLIGMSVPPVAMAQISTRIYDQWLCKLM